MKSKSDSKRQKTVVITGASKGIGLATAKLFAQKGYKVFDLSRSGKTNQVYEHFDCDVTQSDSLTSAREQILQRCNCVDAVICNAGYGISGAVEFTTTQEAKRQFDVNFFGAFDTAKAFLGQMRKQGFGHIVFVGSVAGVFAIPFQAFYSASKSALNALACALKQEVKGFGIKVSVVMPGDTKTEFTAGRQKSVLGQDVYSCMQKSVSLMERDEQKGKSAYFVAKLIYKQATKKRPKILVTAGAGYKTLVFLKRLLPETMSNNIVGGMYCKK